MSAATPGGGAAAAFSSSSSSSQDSPAQRAETNARWLGDPRRCAIADCVLLALAAAAVAVCLLSAHGAARLLLVLLGACLLPGGALLTRLPVEDVLEAVALAVGIGFSIEAAGALAMAWTGWWHPYAWALVLLGAACAMFVLDLRRSLATVREPAS
jgi:uncharacterized membrane protein